MTDYKKYLLKSQLQLTVGLVLFGGACFALGYAAAKKDFFMKKVEKEEELEVVAPEEYVMTEEETEIADKNSALDTMVYEMLSEKNPIYAVTDGEFAEMDCESETYMVYDDGVIEINGEVVPEDVAEERFAYPLETYRDALIKVGYLDDPRFLYLYDKQHNICYEVIFEGATYAEYVKEE